MNKTNTILNNNDVSMTITIVTPDIAKQWLKQNTNNRKIKEAVVDAYAKSMLRRGMSYREVAKELGRTQSGVAHKCAYIYNG